MTAFSRSFEISSQISVEDFKARVKAYPLQPGIMKTVPFPMHSFLIQNVGEMDFEVSCESHSRRSIRARVILLEKNGAAHVKVNVWQDWRRLVVGFLFLGLLWISAFLKWSELTMGGIGLLMFWGAFPLILMRILWYFEVGRFRHWLKDGLMGP